MRAVFRGKGLIPIIDKKDEIMILKKGYTKEDKTCIKEEN